MPRRKTPPPPPNWVSAHPALTLRQAADYLGVNLNTLRQWAHLGKVPTRKWDGDWRFTVEELDTFRASFSERMTFERRKIRCQNPPPPPPASPHEMVAFSYIKGRTGICFDGVCNPGRSPRIAFARWAYALALLDMGWTLAEVGRRLDRDHSTITHMVGHADRICPEQGAPSGTQTAGEVAKHAMAWARMGGEVLDMDDIPGFKEADLSRPVATYVAGLLTHRQRRFDPAMAILGLQEVSCNVDTRRRVQMLLTLQGMGHYASLIPSQAAQAGYRLAT